MTVIFTEEDLSDLRRNSDVRMGRNVILVTPTGGATVSRAIMEVLANASYTTAEVDPVPKSNIFDTKYSRQREWWNTPKKERRRKK